MRIIVLIFLISVSSWANGNEAIDRFKLFTNCAAVELVIENVNSDADAKKIGLTDKSIQMTVESRLRSARIYASELKDNYLYVNINVGKTAFGISLEFHKKVFDSISQDSWYATTWDTGATGTHGNQGANFILSSLSEFVDEFLVEYLRANEEAC